MPYEDFAPFTREDVLVHPAYEPRSLRESFFGSDLALVTLQNSIQFWGFDFLKTNLKPICIWPYDTLGQIPNLNALKVSMSGFGMIRTEMPQIRAPYPHFFDKVGYVDKCKYIVPYRLCYYPRVKTITENFLL